MNDIKETTENTATENLSGFPSFDKPWLKYYTKETKEAPLPEGSIYEYFLERNHGNMNRVALRYYGRDFTYKTLIANIETAASAFKALGVEQGDVVSICSPNLPESITAFYALNKIGAVACMLNPMNSENDIIRDMKEVNSKVLVMISNFYFKFKSSLEKTEVEKVILISPANSLPLHLKMAYKYAKKDFSGILPKNYLHWKNFMKLGERPVKTVGSASSKAVVLHTGGTTGEPKGVLISNLSFNTMVFQLIDASRAPGSYKSGPGDVLWPIVPMFYGYGLCAGIHVPLCYGMTVLIIPQPDVSQVYDIVNKYRPNLIFGIPSYYEAMMNEPRFSNLNLSFFKYIVSGGDGMAEETEKVFNTFLKKRGANVKLTKGYGMTELTAVASLSMPACNVPGSIGVPMCTNNVRIIDPDTGEEKTYNEIGEICFSSPTLMDSYYNNREETDKVIWTDEEGTRWIHTGDLGLITEDGLLYHKGRLKRIVITYYGNEKTPHKLYPDNIENNMLKHPAVLACATISIPHPDLVNVAKSFVILCDGYKPSEKMTKELMKHCHIHLPEYSIPAEIEYIEDFPRTNVGKVDYRALAGEKD